MTFKRKKKAPDLAEEKPKDILPFTMAHKQKLIQELIPDQPHEMATKINNTDDLYAS